MSWWQLRDIVEQARTEFDTYWSSDPMACPICGEPLHRTPPGGYAGTASSDAPAPPADGAAVSLYCPWGHYQYPRDHHRPPRSW